MATLVEIEQAVGEFESVQCKFERFGAYDTEPDVVFQRVLVRAFKGTKQLPAGPRAWQLYTGMNGVREAAKQLTEAADKVRKLIDEFLKADPKHSFVEELEKYLRDYCWRITW